MIIQVIILEKLIPVVLQTQRVCSPAQHVDHVRRFHRRDAVRKAVLTVPHLILAQGLNDLRQSFALSFRGYPGTCH